MAGPIDDDEELRMAVVLNGGVSLAVWIGGVCFELWQFAHRKGAWEGTKGARLDVLAGTSAGGLNAAFLAAANLDPEHANLGAIRSMWLQVAGLEPYAANGDKLLKDPSDKRSKSILDGELFFFRLRDAILELLPETNSYIPDDKRVDLQLTATSLHGVSDDERDDVGGVFQGRRFDSAFHFRHGLHARQDFIYGTPAERMAVANALALAARATASFPGAFEPVFAEIATTESDSSPSIVGPSVIAAGDPKLRTLLRDSLGTASPWPLFDGGVLIDLPVEKAVMSIFSMPAAGRVRRVLAAVVPDPAMPSSTSGPAPSQAAPMIGEVVQAALVSIPRSQSVAKIVEAVRDNNATVKGRSDARWTLMGLSQTALDAAAEALWCAYAENRRRHSANLLADKRWSPQQLYDHLPADLPWLPSSFPPVPTTSVGTCWGASTVRRMCAVMLDLVGRARFAGVPRSAWRACLGRVHDVREVADQIQSLFKENWFDPPAEAGEEQLADLLERACALWPAQTEVGATYARQKLNDQIAELSSCLVDLMLAWPSELSRPTLFAPGFDPQRILFDIEVIQCSFAGFQIDSEQWVELGILSPRLACVLDPHGRAGADRKLAGDQLAHFGAFLKASWRANDWMWGRLDAATFVSTILKTGPEPVGATQQNEIATRIVMDEAPFICAGLVHDRNAGARNLLGRNLFGNRRTPDTEDEVATWERVVERCGLDSSDVTIADTCSEIVADVVAAKGAIAGAGSAATAAQRTALDVERARRFLDRLRIGEETIRSEAPTPLLARIGTQAAAMTARILDDATLPVVQRAVSAVAKPVRGIATAGFRFTRTARPAAAGYPRSTYLAAVGLIVVPAILGFLDLFNLFDIGWLAPIAWLWLAGALLGSALLAPVTSVALTIAVAGAGLLASLPRHPPNWLPSTWIERYRPDGQLLQTTRWRWHWLPLNHAIAIGIIVVACAVMPTWIVGLLDEGWRRIRLRAAVTTTAWSRMSRLDQEHAATAGSKDRVFSKWWPTLIAVVAVTAGRWVQVLRDDSAHAALLVAMGSVVVMAAMVCLAWSSNWAAVLVIGHLSLPAPSQWGVVVSVRRIVFAALGAVSAGGWVLAALDRSDPHGGSVLYPALGVAPIVVLIAIEIWRRLYGGSGDRAMLWAAAPAATVAFTVLVIGHAPRVTDAGELRLFATGIRGAMWFHFVMDVATPVLVYFWFGFAVAVRTGLSRFGFAFMSVAFAAWQAAVRHATPGDAILSFVVWLAISHLALFTLRARSRSVAGPLLLLSALVLGQFFVFGIA